MNHTPGPWTIEKNAGGFPGSIRVWDKNHYMVSDIGIRRNINDHGEGPEELGNAHLIAAAPELLEACEMALDALGDAQANHREGRIVDTSGERDQLRFAIDKATGGQP